MACARLRSAMSDPSVVIDARAGDDLSAIGGEWELDPSHSALEFVARYAMFTLVRGRFTSFSGHIEIDPTHPDAIAIAVDIDASSIDSAMPLRDQHLLGDDFLDVEHHPKITFRAHGATLLAAGRYTVTGELTIRGIAQPVRLVVDLFGRAPDVLGNPRLGCRVTGRLQRTRWNITWNAPVLGGGVALEDNVDLELDVSLVPAGTLARPPAGPD
jgi:polyisoprenoid-binding protein YceI